MELFASKSKINVFFSLSFKIVSEEKILLCQKNWIYITLFFNLRDLYVVLVLEKRVSRTQVLHMKGNFQSEINIRSANI